MLSDVVVETHLPAYDLRGFLAHQLRWARGVRDARTGGYLGLVTTYGLMWGLLALIASRAAPWAWAVLGVTVLLRFAVALAVGRVVLQDRQVFRQLWLLPVRDLFAVVVWFASFVGHTVTWRGDRFELRKGTLDPDFSVIATSVMLPVRGRNQLEASIGKQPVAASTPGNRIAEESCKPETKTQQVFDWQQQPVESSPARREWKP